MEYLHRTLKLVTPNDWGQYEVKTAPHHAGNVDTDWKSISIVGSVHMGIEPFSITESLTIVGEPDNPHDDTALQVQLGENAIGYIPKAAKHWFGSVHPKVWNAPKEGFYLTHDGAWNVQMGVPKCWLKGYYDYNAGCPDSHRHDVYPNSARERNSWLAGYNAAKEYGDMLS